MPRKSTGAKPCGRPPKVTGYIAQFLHRHTPRYIAASTPNGTMSTTAVKKRVGIFYDGVTNLLMHKFGVDVDLEVSPVEDPPEPEEAKAHVSLKQARLSDVEERAFDERWKKLRTVSTSLNLNPHNAHRPTIVVVIP